MKGSKEMLKCRAEVRGWVAGGGVTLDGLFLLWGENVLVGTGLKISGAKGSLV